jgi:dihydroorotate dehydrogenase (NAD+) catalytic subunit
MVNLSVNIKDLYLKNPVMTASGCSGFGEELNDFFDVSRLGRSLLKGITPETGMETLSLEWLKQHPDA